MTSSSANELRNKINRGKSNRNKNSDNKDIDRCKFFFIKERLAYTKFPKIQDK